MISASTLFAFSAILAIAINGTSTAQTWTDLTANLPVAPKVGTGQSLASDGTAIYVLASPNGILRSTDDGNTWSPFHTVTGASYDLSQFGSRSIDAIGTTLWAGVEPGSGGITQGVLPLYRTTAPSAWTPSFAGAAPPAVVDSVAYDSSTNTHWAAGRLGGIFKSTNGGSTWVAANGNLPGTNCASIVARNGKVIAAITGNGMGAFTSTDSGGTWKNNGVPLPSIGSLTAIGDNVSVIGTGDTSVTSGIYFSRDFGLTWHLNQVDTAGGLKLLSNTCSDTTTMFSGGVFVSVTTTVTRIPTVAFSLNGGTTWDDLPASGIPNGVGTQPERICRHGKYLFTITGDNKLYRLDLTTVTLTPTLKIAIHPVIDKKITGGTLTMKVYAGGPGTLGYVWKKDNIDVPGQITDTLSIPNAQPSATGNYTCVVTAGGDSVTSNPARGTVVDKIEGRYDPTYDRTNMSGGDSGTPFLQSDGSLLVVSSGGAYRLGPDGGRTDSRIVGSAFNGRTVDSSGRLVFVGGTNAATWRVRRVLGSAGFPDDTSFPQLSANNTLRTVTELPGHGYLVSGDFTTMGPAGGTQVTVPRLVLIDYDGSLNTTFNANITTLIGLGASATPYVATDGTVWLLVAAGFRKVDATGLPVAGFTNYTPGPSSDFVSSAALLKSGKMLVTLTNSGSSRPFKLFNTDGSFDNTFNPANLVLNNVFSAVTEQADGRIILGGSFTSFGSSPCSGRYMRISATGVFDSTFYNATGFSTAGWNGMTYDPRGYVLMSNDANNATTGTFQDSSTIGDTIGKNFVRVFATAAPADPFATWASGFPFPVGKDGPNDDADGDGLPNLIEFLYGGNPLVGSSPGLGQVFPTKSVADGAAINVLAPGAGLDPAKKYQLLALRVPKNTQGYTIGLSATVNLPAFDGSAMANEYGTPADDGAYEIKTYYLTPSQTDSPKMFWRAFASQ